MKIVTFVDSKEKYRFFKRLSLLLKLRGIEIIYITHRLSIKIDGTLTKQKVYLLKKTNKTLPKKCEEQIAKSVELLAGHLTKQEAYDLFISVHDITERIVDEVKDLIGGFIFNGGAVPELAVSSVLDFNKIKVLYFELSNIPGKIFCDEKGVNYFSSLVENIKKLNKYEVPELEWNNWKECFIKSRTVNTIPQAKIIKKINMNYFVDYLGYKIFRIPYQRKPKLIYKIYHKLLLWIYKARLTDKYDPRKGFIFLPLQVSDDTQLLFHSKLSNEDAINYSLENAKKNNLNLLVKLHPAELSISFMKRIYSLRNIEGLYITKESASKLISECEMVHTINSTIGLEAKILNKKVIFLGDSIYNLMDKHQIKAYILRYLLPIDFYDEDCESTTLNERIIEFYK